MHKNYEYPDVFSAPVTDSDYFIPLKLTLDPVEKSNFNAFYEEKLLPNIHWKKALYSPMGDCSTYFPKTIEQTKQFLEPIGLTVRSLTVFVSPPGGNVEDVKNVHVDSTKLPNGESVILEARLSYYEMADTPGIVRWFPADENYTNREEHIPGQLVSNIWTLPWIQDLKQGALTWEQVPEWVCASSTNTPSGLIRTNVPHHVIQGSGNRLTISAQIIFKDSRSPVGVWQHIKNNLHLLKLQ
jgi:hypothetical protein